MSAGGQDSVGLGKLILLAARLLPAVGQAEKACLFFKKTGQPAALSGDL